MGKTWFAKIAPEEEVMSLQIRCQKSFDYDGVQLLLLDRESRTWVSKLEMVSYKELEKNTSNIFLTPENAQSLMDNLWECGLRPSEGSGSAGALAATQRHLEDMRKLVFENITNITNKVWIPNTSCDGGTRLL